MNELAEKTRNLIELMEQYCEFIAADDLKEKKKMLPKVTQQMMEVLPQIIQSYSRPEFNEVAEDMNYWTGQLSRILGAVSQNDCFFLYDVIKFETIDNLKLYLKMIERVETL